MGRRRGRLGDRWNNQAAELRVDWKSASGLNGRPKRKIDASGTESHGIVSAVPGHKYRWRKVGDPG